jgi:vancomycin resistance protein VanJ
MRAAQARWATRLTIVYCLGMALWYTAWQLAGDRGWWLTLINYTATNLFFPAPIFLLWALWRRSSMLTAAALLPLALFATIIWPQPAARAPQPAQAATLRIMTFNVLYSNADVGAIVKVVGDYRPDLIAFQEVTPEMMRALSAALGAQYPYAQFGAEHPYGSVAAFSQHPLARKRTLDFGVDRAAVILEALVHGRRVQFVAAHLTAYGLHNVPLWGVPARAEQETRNRAAQVRLLLEEIGRTPGEIVILACDCNSPETASATRMLESELTNTAQQVGWWPATGRLRGMPDLDPRHIDYVFYRGQLAPRGIAVAPEAAGSDHRPVVAEFGMP